jgi:hypothetical protein
MDSSTIAHDLRAREWRQIILEANNSDIPKSQYIREHHLDDLMPWSETYRKYEQEQAAQDPSLAIGGEDPPRPRTPRKKDKQRSAWL